jgi:hypothetical protein
MDTEENLKEYRWETGYERTWEAITEDQSGGIEVSVQEMLQVNFNQNMFFLSFDPEFDVI